MGVSPKAAPASRTPPDSSSKKHGRDSAVTPRSVLPAVLVLLTLSACGALNPDVSGSPLSQGSAGVSVSTHVQTTPAHTANTGACIDPSGSTVSTFSITARMFLAQTVDAWVSDQKVTTGGSSATVGLNLQLRQVLTNSFSSSAPSVTVAIPPVPGLKPRLDVNDPNFTTDDPSWVAARKQNEILIADARQAARKGSRDIQTYRLLEQNSEITGCLSALAATVEGAKRAFILASDLEQTEPAQVAGDLQGTDILVVQPCGGNASECTALATSWRSALKGRGAGLVTFIRPEDSSVAVFTAFLKSAAS